VEMSFQTVTADIRQTLRLFSWARAQHRLRGQERAVTFSNAANLIEVETGLELAAARAALGGGFSSKDTQKALAAWTGLKLAAKHGQPVLVADLAAGFERGPGGGVGPVPIEEARRRVDTRGQAA